MVVTVLLTINTEPGRLDEIYSIVKDFDEVTFSCLAESGPYHIIAMVEVDSLDGYRELIERVADLPHTENFASFIALDV